MTITPVRDPYPGRIRQARRGRLELEGAPLAPSPT
jgi:hypothetical protein